MLRTRLIRSEIRGEIRGDRVDRVDKARVPQSYLPYFLYALPTELSTTTLICSRCADMKKLRMGCT